MTEEKRERVAAFQIGVEPVGSMLNAYLLPPDRLADKVAPDKILLASVRLVIWREPGMREVFDEFLKAIAAAMVTRHVDAETAATMETRKEPYPDDKR